jgi:hypothetical protein
MVGIAPPHSRETRGALLGIDQSVRGETIQGNCSHCATIIPQDWAGKHWYARLPSK